MPSQDIFEVIKQLEGGGNAQPSQPQPDITPQTNYENTNAQNNTPNQQSQSSPDIFSAISQIEFGQSSTFDAPLLSTNEINDIIGKSAGLNLMQNLMLSFAPNDESKIGYLANEFQGADIKSNSEKGLMINGLPVNPKGLDVGDISRNAGGILPFAGQVVGGILGASAGPAGVFGGGVSGATVGKGIQLATGKLLGLSIEGDQVAQMLAEEAGTAAVGEVVGLGAGKLITKLGKSKAIKGIADIYKKSFDKVGKEAIPTITQFVGNINPNATRVFQKEGMHNLEKHMDPDGISKLANKVLFNKDSVPTAGQFFGKTDIQQGTIDIVKSIKGAGAKEYDDLIKFVSNNNIDENLISNIKSFGIDDLVDPTHTRESRPLELADGIIGSVKARVKHLGEKLGAKEAKFISKNKNATFDLQAINSINDKLVKEIDVGEGINVPGFNPSGGVNVKGLDKIKEIQEIFKAVPKGKNKAVSLSSITMEQAAILKKNFDVKIDEFFLDKNIPSEPKNTVRLIADNFRSTYWDKLGLTDEAASFRGFQEIMDGLKINSQNQRKSIELLVKGFSNRSGQETGRLTNILKELPQGNKLIKDLKLHQIGTSLAKIDSKGLVTSFERTLSHPDILNLVRNPSSEHILKSIDQGLRDNARTSSKAFFKEAQMYNAGKEFLGGVGVNLLRVQTLASLTGVVSLGGVLGGPLGMGVAGTMALAMQNPRVIAKVLIALDKKATKKASGNLLKKEIISPDKIKKIQEATLRRLITQSAQQRNNQGK